LTRPEQSEVAAAQRRERACARNGLPLRRRLHSPRLSSGSMRDLLRVACVQMTSRAGKAANLEQAETLVARAAATGADVVFLPEKWNLIGSVDDLHAGAEALDGGESVVAMSAWARRHGVALVGGSIVERRDGREKLSNT